MLNCQLLQALGGTPQRKKLIRKTYFKNCCLALRKKVPVLVNTFSELKLYYAKKKYLNKFLKCCHFLRAQALFKMD